MVKQLFLWKFRLGNERAEQRKKKIKKSEKVRTRERVRNGGAV